MRITKSYTLGIKKAFAEGKMLLLLWLFNVLFASAIYFQFSDFLSQAIGSSASAANFLRTLDFNVLVETLTFNGAAWGTIVSLAAFLLLSYGFFSIFLIGGILQTLMAERGHGASGEKRRLAPLFFQGAGRYFGRFFRLFLFSLVMWAGLAVFMTILAMFLVPFAQMGTSEATTFYVVLVVGAIGLFLVFLIMMIVDYTRIRIAVDGTSAVLKSLFRSMDFVFRRLGKTLGLYYLYLLTAAAIFAVYWAVSSAIKTHSLLPILIAFLIGQVFILSRVWVKVALQASQLEFFRAAAPPAPETPAPEAQLTSVEEASPGSSPKPGPES